MARKTPPPPAPKRDPPPRYDEAMAGRTRQALHKQKLQADLVEVAFALRLVLRPSDADTKAAFRANYRGAGGERLHRGLRACLKGGSESNAEVLARIRQHEWANIHCQGHGISSDDKNNGN